MATTHQTFLEKLQGKKKPQCPPEERYPGIRYAMTPAVTIIVGRKGMGKSCMIVDALRNPKALKWIYDKIIIFSGTFRTQYHNLWSKLSSKGIVVFEELDELILMNVYEQQLGSPEHVLILSDDMDQQWAKMDQQVVNKIITNSRHCNLSLCFLVQKMSMVPTIIRSNADCVVAYATSCHREFEAIYNEFSHCSKKEFHKFFCEATSEPYSFLVCCVQSGKVEMYINFQNKIY